jgi:hypothetical protein
VSVVIKMSGAAGLSAAKRRRGGSGVPMSGPMSGPMHSRPQPRPPPNARPPANARPPPPPGMSQISPMQILENHETRLNNLDQHLQDIIESFGSRDGTASEESLVFFRDRTLQLEQKILELESLLHKVQTFSMETNTMVLKSNKAAGEAVGETMDDDVLSEYDDTPEVGSDADVGDTTVEEPIELEITG